MFYTYSCPDCVTTAKNYIVYGRDRFLKEPVGVRLRASDMLRKSKRIRNQTYTKLVLVFL